MSKATQIQRKHPQAVYADRVSWERGITAGGRDFKSGKRNAPLTEGRVFELGYREGLRIEMVKQRKADEMEQLIRNRWAS